MGFEHGQSMEQQRHEHISIPTASGSLIATEETRLLGTENDGNRTQFPLSYVSLTTEEEYNYGIHSNDVEAADPNLLPESLNSHSSYHDPPGTALSVARNV